MSEVERGVKPNAPSRRGRFSGILILINLGLLVSFVFGPNLGHSHPIVSYAALGAVLVGLLLMLRFAIIERRRKPLHPKAL